MNCEYITKGGKKCKHIAYNIIAFRMKDKTHTSVMFYCDSHRDRLDNKKRSDEFITIRDIPEMTHIRNCICSGCFDDRQ